MANVLFTRTSDPNSKPVTDGQLIFDTSGNGKMYLDNGTDRLEMGGAVTVDATLSKTSTNPVQNKAVAGVMLDTLSDISNVTSKGFLTDALAVKELNNNLTNINVYVGEDEKLHFVDSIGADSVLPFKSAPTLVGTYSGNQTIDVSSVVGANDTVNNFIVEIISIPAKYGTSLTDSARYSGAINGTTVSKTLSGNNLIISGATITGGVSANVNMSANALPVTSPITYKVWHV